MKSKFCVSFGNEGPRILEEEWRGTESKASQVQWEVSAVCDELGRDVICWCWWLFTVFLQVQSQRSTSCFHLLINFMEMPDSLFLQDSAAAHGAENVLLTMLLLRLICQPSGLQ